MASSQGTLTTPAYDDQTGKVNPDATVSGQLAKNLATDSPLMQSARTGAMQTANDRGLLNSSIAAGSGEQAVINQALPIAEQDAQTNAGFGGQVLTGNQAVNLQNIQNANQQLMGTSSNAANLYGKTQASVSDILNNPDLNINAQQNAINQQAQLLQSGLGLIGGINNLDLTGLLDFGGVSGDTSYTTIGNQDPNVGIRPH